MHEWLPAANQHQDGVEVVGARGARWNFPVLASIGRKIADHRDLAARQVTLFIIFGLTCLPATAQSLFAVSADYNGDGILDIKIIRRGLYSFVPTSGLGTVVPTAFVHTISLDSSSNGFYLASGQISDPALPTPPWNTTNVTLRSGDIDGDGVDECFIESEIPSLPSFSVNCDIGVTASVKQMLDASIIGIDLGQGGYSASLSDENGDGRADLVIRLDGALVTVLLASPDGLFSAEDPTNADGGLSASIGVLWSDFRARINANDPLGAAAAFRLDARPTMEQVFTQFGSGLSAIDESWSSLTPVSVQSSYAEFTITQTINGATTLYLVTFLRNDDGTWAIGSL